MNTLWSFNFVRQVFYFLLVKPKSHVRRKSLLEKLSIAFTLYGKNETSLTSVGQLFDG